MPKKETEILSMLFRACSLLAAEHGIAAPDWVRIVANANEKHLAEAVEIALEDDSYTGFVDEEDDDGRDRVLES